MDIALKWSARILRASWRLSRIVYIDGRGLSAALCLTMLLLLALTTTGFSAEQAKGVGVKSISPIADKELESGHFKEACKIYSLVLATHPTDVTTLLKAAKAYEGAGDLDEAIAKARSATRFGADNADAHLTLGHLLDINRDERAAILQFEVVLELKSVSAEKRKVAYGPLLRLLKHESEMVKLLKVARQGARDLPQDPDSHYNLAWALSQMPNIKPKDYTKIQLEAIAEYRRSIALGEKQANVHYNLAVLLAAAEENIEARKELATFLELAPEAKETAGAKELAAKLRD